jgi:hypothetical protein
VALIAIVFGLDFHKKFLRPKFTYKLKASDQKIDGATNTIYRLLVTNDGRRVAEGVTAMVVGIDDRIKGRYKTRKDFIHMPLNWTHHGFEPRMLPAKQGVYLDVARYEIFSEPSLVLMTLGVEEISLYSLDSESKIKIRFGETGGYVDEILLALRWNVKTMGPVFSLSQGRKQGIFERAKQLRKLRT